MNAIELTPEHPIEEVTELAVTAERAGFDTVLASCHYFNRDPYVALDRIADATEEVALGPAAANPYDTHPVALASRVATIQEVSDGRAVFGVGPGDRSTLSALGVERDSPLRRVLETFKVAQDLWAGESVDADGTFQAADADLEYAVEGEIPVYVGAQGPHMIRMSAKHADGVLYNGSHPRDMAWAAEQVEKGLADRPDERGDFDFAAYASVSVADEEAAAREAARPPVAFIAGGAAPPVLDRHDLDQERAEEIGAAIEAGSFSEAFGLVTEAMIDAFCIAGTQTQVENEVEAVMEYADSFVVGAPLGPDLERAIELAGAVLR
ncbi:5,10-methylenetetrahydromethanopterin reductase [Halorientalis regularis]|jgi:5,10-methylenetetrahydromethanopterin reductase|uniref:5,10-methylenetetrahydromethanopterin reductase n=1 Tax=Halorientalis regularis TaxID=660518 RepID=A0A1G7L3T3_9EURY|nr:5,10-methylenetetrahydromethanopterin reductase [Halorientalis regularis]SDF43720.1 5,10-methylenetetrahydromethanopterin reductase [Halorientalis regularis]